MALSPARYRKRWAESSGSSHSISTSAFVRTDGSSCGSRHALRRSSARQATYRPLLGSGMTPAVRPISRVGAVLSFVYPAYLNSKAQSQFNDNLRSHCGAVCCAGNQNWDLRRSREYPMCEFCPPYAPLLDAVPHDNHRIPISRPALMPIDCW
jgi:hypothetical protein